MFLKSDGFQYPVTLSQVICYHFLLFYLSHVGVLTMTVYNGDAITRSFKLYMN